jgi:hypothetical protein
MPLYKLGVQSELQSIQFTALKTNLEVEKWKWGAFVTVVCMRSGAQLRQPPFGAEDARNAIKTAKASIGSKASSKADQVHPIFPTGGQSMLLSEAMAHSEFREGGSPMYFDCACVVAGFGEMYVGGAGRIGSTPPALLPPSSPRRGPLRATHSCDSFSAKTHTHIGPRLTVDPVTCCRYSGCWAQERLLPLASWEKVKED